MKDFGNRTFRAGMLLLVALVLTVMLPVSPAAGLNGLVTDVMRLTSVSAVDSCSVRAAGMYGNALFFDGNSWIAEETYTTQHLYGIDSVDENHTWAVGENGTVLFNDGDGWEKQGSGTAVRLNDVFALDRGHVWAVGNAGTILFYDGDAWAPQDSGTDVDLYGISGFDDSGIWAVGCEVAPLANGTVLYYDGFGWATRPDIPNFRPSDISALDPEHLYVTGWDTGKTFEGGLMVYDGDSWTEHSTGEDQLESVDAYDPSHVWAVGNGTNLYFYDGSTLSPQGDPDSSPLRGVSALDSENVWAAGDGSIVYFDGNSWSGQELPGATARGWGHDSIAVAQPSNTWYLAEGSTKGGFETWILVQNPNDAPADVSLAFQTEGGEVAGPTDTIPANSRSTFEVAQHVETYEVSTKVTATAPVIAERSMYYQNRRCAHDSTGVTQPAKTWYLAEGSTYGGFETWVLVQNPGPNDASVTLTFQTDEGEMAGPTEVVEANSRETFEVANCVETYEVSTRVESTQDVIAERSMYFSTPQVYRQCAHDSIGATQPAETWYLAEGSTYGGFETWVLVQNPNTEAAEVTLSFQTDGGPRQGPTQIIEANSRYTFEVSRFVQAWDVSTTVTSEPGKPVIAERSMYFSTPQVYRQCAHDSIGVTQPTETWYLAEGSTGPGFETWVLVQNPSGVDVEVDLTYLTPYGQVEHEGLPLEANSRRSFKVSNTLAGRYEVSTAVEATGPVVVERSMYGDSGL